MVSESPSSGRLSGLRIVVVEDQPDHLDLVTRMLVEAGAKVRGLSSGQEAFDDVHADPPDVLIVDLGLPGVSGATLARRARALPGARSMAIVAFTANATREKREEALRHGIDYYVLKPDVVRLVHVVAHAAGRAME
jgi:CheY-like chemotaxis protein